MSKENLPKVDIDVKGSEVEAVIKTAGVDGISPLDLAKELGHLSDNTDPLKTRAILQKVRAAARRVIKSKGWSVIKDGKGARYSVKPGGNIEAKKADTSTKDAIAENQ